MYVNTMEVRMMSSNGVVWEIAEQVLLSALDVPSKELAEVGGA